MHVMSRLEISPLAIMKSMPAALRDSPTISRHAAETLLYVPLSNCETHDLGQPQASGANNTDVNATKPEIPYLHGRWKVYMRYSEIKGSMGVKSGCTGVWPYIYSIEYDLYQRRGSPEYVLCRQAHLGHTLMLGSRQQRLHTCKSCECQT